MTARRRGTRRTAWLASLGVLVLAVGSIVPTVWGAQPAQAAPPDAIAVSVSADGFAPWDALDGADDNGVVRTHDQVKYDLSVTPTAQNVTDGSVTVTVTAPAGLVWDPATLAGGEPGSAVIGQTLTMVLPVTTTAPVIVPLLATVSAMANGTLLEVTAESEGVISGPATVTVAAAPRVRVRFDESAGVGSALVDGSRAATKGVIVTLSQRRDAAGRAVGTEPLQSPITFTMDAPDPSAIVTACFRGGTVLSAQGTGPSAITNSGTWTCDQPGGPGTPVTVTVTGADTTLDRFPTVGGLASDGTRAIFAQGFIRWAIPYSALPDDGSAVTMQSQARNISMTSITGAPGLDTTGGYNTTYFGDSSPFSNFNNGVRFDVFQLNEVGAIVSMTPPGTSASTLLSTNNLRSTQGFGQVTAGQEWDAWTTFLVNAGASQSYTAFTGCMIWDPALQTIAAPGSKGNPYGSGTLLPGTAVFEYGVAGFADDDARRAADCGEVGDAATGWYASIDDVPGGAAAVTQVRFAIPGAEWTAGSAAGFRVPMVRTSDSLAAGTPIPTFATYRTAESGLVPSTYDRTTNTAGSGTSEGRGGSRVVSHEAEITHTVAWDVTTTQELSEVRQLTVTPEVVYGTSTGTTETITLPAGASYQGGSAQWGGTPIAPASVTVSGSGVTTLVFNLGTLEAGVAPALTLGVILDPGLLLPNTIQTTAVIASPVSRTPATSTVPGRIVRTASAAFDISAPMTVAVTKTVSTAMTSDGLPFFWTVSWSNRTGNALGSGWFVDVLPFDGDGRGTTGLDGLTIDSVEITQDTSGATIEYTTDDPETVLEETRNDPSGNTGIIWTAGDPSGLPGVTAIRFAVPDPFDNGELGVARITVTPGPLSRGGLVVNDVYGHVEGWLAPLEGVAETTLRSSLSVLSGNVFRDVDRSFARDAGDDAVADPAVTIVGGYGFGANGIDDDGGGDDVAYDEIPGVNLTAVVDTAELDDLLSGTPTDGDYAFVLPPGAYDVRVTPAGDDRVVVLPEQSSNDPKRFIPDAADAAQTGESIVLNGGDLPGVDFGVQEPIAPPTAQGGADTIPLDGTTAFPADEVDVTWEDADPEDVLDPAVTGIAGELTSATTTATGTGAPSQAEIEAAFTLDDDPDSPDFGRVDFDGTGLPAGTYTYTVTWTDAWGQTGTSTYAITIQPLPTADDDTATIPVGGSATLNGNPASEGGTIASGVASGVPAGATVTVDPATGDVVFDAEDTLAPGEYTFTVTWTDDLDQTSESEFTVTVQAPPTASDQGSTIKPGDTATYDANPVTTGTIKAVEAGPGVGPAGADQAAIDDALSVDVDGAIVFDSTGLPAGTYTYELTWTDNFGQTGTSTVTVVVQAGPTAQGGSAKLPVGASTEFDAQVTTDGTITGATVTAATGPAGVDRAVVDAAIQIDADGTIVFNQDGDDLPAGIYTYTVTFTDNLGQTASAVFAITVQAPPTAQGGKATIDPGEKATFDGNPQTTGIIASAEARNVPDGATVTVNVDGRIVFDSGSLTPGTYTFQVVWTDDLGQTVTSEYEVTITKPLAPAPTPQGPSADTGASLANTGASPLLLPLGATASVALLGGAVLLAFAVRRRKRA